MFFVILILVLLFHYSFESCPPGSVEFFKDKTQCLYFNNNSTQYLNAETVCANLGGHLSSVENLAKNIFISQHALITFTDSEMAEFWFGVNAFENKWTWMDDSPLDFINWDTDEPKNNTGTICGAMIMNSGKWIADDCYKTKPFVCLVNAISDSTSLPLTTTPKTTTITTTTRPTTTTIVKQKSCVEPWVFYNITESCYIVLGSQSYSNAEKTCKNYGAHLVSIHSVNENLFVTHLAQPNIAYIGLQAHVKKFQYTWKWSDGTTLNYENWAGDRPKKCNWFSCRKCGAILTSGLFTNFKCDEQKTFICKKSAV